ncbi:L-threonylcarbamoyladenylate synthase [Halobaculum sp. MBLA0147]|uniref:L-threonylcarbamoyladenylate synthase n=1 Tax=Halobaculum sp. MBLA0147 TaxID=3079934 RepID=UPI003525E4A7
MTDTLDHAAGVLREGGLVVYPTETVYGLGADATDATAVERVFDAKGRDREKPLSAGFPDVETALDATAPSDRATAFAREFLPGPVTVVVTRGPQFPDVLTAGSDRVGIRVPADETARELAARAECPVTATSANRSGTGSVRRVATLSASIRDRVDAVVDTGETPGGESTVVDPERGVIHRAGPRADAIRDWLDE